MGGGIESTYIWWVTQPGLVYFGGPADGELVKLYGPSFTAQLCWHGGYYRWDGQRYRWVQG